MAASGLFLAAIVASWPCCAAAADDLAGLRALGAVTLVERAIDARQVTLGSEPRAWAEWEIARIEHLLARRSWRAILERRPAYPELLSADLRVAADDAAARSHRALGDPASALRILDGLLAAPGGTPEARARWSRLRVRALLDSADVEAARAALALHRDAHPDDVEERAILEARLLLLDGHLEEVVLFLDGIESTEGEVLRLAAVAASGPVDPWGYLRAASRVTDGATSSAAERYQAWVLVAQVAAARRELDLAAVALEHALAEDVDDRAPGLLARTGGDALWAAYEALARRAGNERQLLVGRFDDWLALGVERAADDPVAARALLAFVALRADRAAVREAAGERYAALVGADEGHRRVAGALWTGSRALDGMAAIPESVRPVLVIDLVARGRFEAAGALVPDALSALVGGGAPWRVAYARALIRVGLPAAGVEMLAPLLTPGIRARPALWRASVAASADLIAAAHLDEADRVLGALARGALDPARKAVVAFQRGELMAARGEHAAAAGAYLEAALGLAGDDARAARRRAADAAARAGLAEDAAGIRAALVADPGSLARLRGEPIR